MSERIHAPSAARSTTGSKRKIVLVAAGTTIAVLCAAVIIQVFRAETGIAADGAPGGDDGNVGRASLSGDETQKYPLARVNNEIISQDKVAAECLARYGKDVLESIINRTIIEQACKERGVEVTAAEVDAEIIRIAKKFELPVETWYQMLQAERDITPMQYRTDVIWPMLALRKLAGTKIEVDEKDLQQAFLREYGPRVKAKMIMFEKLRHAQEVWEQAQRDPENFGRLAREHSIEPTSRALDGDVPPIRRYTGNDALVDTAFKLKPGEISGIVQSGQPGAVRYVILKCEGHTEPIITDINEVREELHSQLHEQKVQESVAQIFEKLKEHSDIDNYLTNTSTRSVKQTSGKQSTGAVQPAGGAPGTARTAAKQPQTPPATKN
jgi:foldase protein PrsA